MEYYNNIIQYNMDYRMSVKIKILMLYDIIYKNTNLTLAKYRDVYILNLPFMIAVSLNFLFLNRKCLSKYE